MKALLNFCSPPYALRSFLSFRPIPKAEEKNATMSD